MIEIHSQTRQRLRSNTLPAHKYSFEIPITGTQITIKRVATSGRENKLTFFVDRPGNIPTLDNNRLHKNLAQPKMWHSVFSVNCENVQEEQNIIQRISIDADEVTDRAEKLIKNLVRVSSHILDLYNKKTLKGLIEFFFNFKKEVEL